LLSGVNFTNFYEQLLLTGIPKAQKDSDDLTVFLRSWDLGVKAASKHVGEIDPRKGQ